MIDMETTKYMARAAARARETQLESDAARLSNEALALADRLRAAELHEAAASAHAAAELLGVEVLNDIIRRGNK